ncbi:MAG: hypothetical protein E7668_02350 [Ruminococcaceae bacterium]|nr:hypothetical protein [Oscillospiraceae bacterium]
MNKNNRSANIRKLTTCAMLAALGVVLLYLGSMIEVADLSMAVLASLLCVFAVIEYGGSAPWLVFGVTGLLSLILIPQKTPAVFYLLFFGYYPILKEKLEKRPRVISWVLKEVIFNIALVLILVLSRFLLMASDAQPILLYVIFAVLAEAIFPLYDIALTRLISLYLYKLRKRFRMK